MDNEEEHIKEVYAHFGLALYLAQCLEHGIVNALLHVDLFGGKAATIRARQRTPLTCDECYEIFDQYEAAQFDKTMGGLIGTLRQFGPVPDDLAGLLHQCRERRNFLAHHYFRERAVDLTTSYGREAMLDELKADQRLFEHADAKLSEYVEPLQKVRMTPEKLRAAQEELVARWKADPSKPKPEP